MRRVTGYLTVGTSSFGDAQTLYMGVAEHALIHSQAGEKLSVARSARLCQSGFVRPGRPKNGCLRAFMTVRIKA